MRVEHLNGWLAEARKEEVKLEKAAETEGTTAVIGGTGGEEMEEKRNKVDVEMKNCRKVVDLMRAAFGEGMLAEEAVSRRFKISATTFHITSMRLIPW